MDGGAFASISSEKASTNTSERAIQRLLKEAGASGVSDGVVSVEGSGFEAAADWSSLRSPETYVGYERTQNFASRDAARLDQRRTYRAPSRLALNQWSLAGDWTMGRTATVLNKAPGQILYRFHARDVHLVMGPSRPESAVPFPRDDRRPTTGRGSRSRRRRGWQRNGARAAAVSAGATAEADRRSNVRDRLPRCWRRGVLVHVRLTLHRSIPSSNGFASVHSCLIELGCASGGDRVMSCQNSIQEVLR